MADKTVQVPSQWGPIDLVLKQCDGMNGVTPCPRNGRPEHLVGWYKLGPQGVDIPTFATLPGPLDFCSLECLRDTLPAMGLPPTTGS